MFISRKELIECPWLATDRYLEVVDDCTVHDL